MPGHCIDVKVGSLPVRTLADILPSPPGLRMLIIGKAPAPLSVDACHYFQGRHGKALWNKLAEYKILNVPSEEEEDDHFLVNGYEITDIVKSPKSFGVEH